MADNNKRKELVVSAIENGTVIDHLPTACVFQVIKILNLESCENQLYFGTNLHSQKYGQKGIIKVRDRFIDNEEANKIALVAPQATVIEIRDYQVINKFSVKIPSKMNKFVKCVNPNCITNVEDVPTKFSIVDKDDDLKLHCHYCEKFTKQENMIFL